MLPKILEELSETDTDIDDIPGDEEEIEEVVEEIEVLEEEDEEEDDEEEEWEEEEPGRKPIALPPSFRRLKPERKFVHYDGSPLRSEPDSDID